MIMWNDGDKQISSIKVPYLLQWGLWYLLENTTGTWLSLWEEANHEDHKSSSSPGLCREQLLCSPREVTLRQEMEELRQREKAELGRWYTLYTFPNIEVTCPTRSVTISISLSQYKLGLGSMILFGEKYNFSPLRTVRTFQLERRAIISISCKLEDKGEVWGLLILNLHLHPAVRKPVLSLPIYIGGTRIDLTAQQRLNCITRMGAVLSDGVVSLSSSARRNRNDSLSLFELV